MQPTPNKMFFDAGQRQRTADRTPVTLYFIGYLLVKDGVLPRFPLKGRVIQAPPIGESIVLDNVLAADLMVRSQIYDPKIGWIQSFTEDPAIAKAIKQAYQDGRLTSAQTPADFYAALNAARVVELTDEQLEAEIERRKPRPKTSAKGETKDG